MINAFNFAFKGFYLIRFEEWICFYFTKEMKEWFVLEKEAMYKSFTLFHINKLLHFLKAQLQMLCFSHYFAKAWNRDHKLGLSTFSLTLNRWIFSGLNLHTHTHTYKYKNLIKFIFYGSQEKQTFNNKILLISTCWILVNKNKWRN